MEGPLTRALCANLGEPHRLQIATMTTLAFWSEIPSSLFLRPFSAGTILSGKQSKLLLHIISFTSVLMCSHCSNWDCCQFMDPWSNRIRRFPIGGLVFCSNLRLTGKLTKITPLMTNNQCRPYKEPIGLSNTRRTCLAYCLSFLLSKSIQALLITAAGSNEHNMKIQCKRPGGMTHSVGWKHGGWQLREVYHHKLAKLKLFGSHHSGGGTVAGNSVREIENLIRRWSKSLLYLELEVCTRETLDAWPAESAVQMSMWCRNQEMHKKALYNWRMKAIKVCHNSSTIQTW